MVYVGDVFDVGIKISARGSRASCAHVPSPSLRHVHLGTLSPRFEFAVALFCKSQSPSGFRVTFINVPACFGNVDVPSPSLRHVDMGTLRPRFEFAAALYCKSQSPNGFRVTFIDVPACFGNVAQRSGDGG